jgi:nitroreductase
MTNKETNMDTLDAIHQRRAIKYFDLTHQFAKEETQQLIESEMQFPSPFNIQHWQL